MAISGLSVYDAIGRVADRSAFDDNTPLERLGFADFGKRMLLVRELHETVGVSIDAEEIAALDTVEDLVIFVEDVLGLSDEVMDPEDQDADEYDDDEPDDDEDDD